MEAEMNEQFQFGAGYWNACKFVRHIYRVIDGRQFSTGYAYESYGANTDEQKFSKTLIQLMSEKGIEFTQSLYPRALTKFSAR
jgi:hypothetical protein